MSGGLTLRLDPLGGVAGDMLVAALLDAYPEREPLLAQALAALDLPESVAWRIDRQVIGGFQGRRFIVDTAPCGHHSHASYTSLRRRISEAAIAPGARTRALDIYHLLAEAEATVHGSSLEAVAFHEVGAWDSLVDVVAAATLIDSLGEASWYCGSLPMGSGTVRSAHGLLPLPAPAAALLLHGMPLHDDGLAGERVTPTGAAILRHLGCRFQGGARGRLLRLGTGLGSRRLPGVLNALRLSALEATADTQWADTGVLLRAAFEVDDQTPEDLAVAVETLRILPGVLDVTTASVQGKKGRLAMRVEVLSLPEAQDTVLRACFEQTTTLGVRYHQVRRATLPRRHEVRQTEAGPVRVKTAHRPGGDTIKAESDDIAAAGTIHRTRYRIRSQAERSEEDQQ